MPDEPLRTFRVKADVLVEAHSKFHAAGLFQMHVGNVRQAMPLPVQPGRNLLRAGAITIEPALGALETGPTRELRQLRLWHWKQARTASKALQDRRSSRHTEKDHRAAYALHMGAVQALNDCFNPGDTAEQDDEAERTLHAR